MTDDEIESLRAENAKLKSRLERRATWRRVLTIVLVVLTSISVVASVIAIWAHETVFDTDRFMATIEPALDDPALYQAVGDRASSEILAALALETRVTEALTNLDEYLSEALLDAVELDDRARQLLSNFDRPTIAALAPSIVEALESRIQARVGSFFSSEEFASRFPGVVRRAHEVTIALVRDDLAVLPNVYIEAGEVRVNLIPPITDALSTVLADIRGFLPDIDLPNVISDRVDEGREQLGAALQARLPEDFGQLTVMSESALEELQEAGKLADRYVWGLVALSLILAAVTIITSTNRRRTTIHLALGVVVAMTIAAVIVRRVEGAILEQISTPDGDHAASSMIGAVMSSLRTVELLLAVAGILIAIGAYLAGRPEWVTRLTTRVKEVTKPGPTGSSVDNWIAHHDDMLRVLAIGLAALAFFITGFGWLPLVLIGTALGLVLWWIAAAKTRVDAVTGTESIEATSGSTSGEGHS